jgi:S-adenosylmethionine:tRNA ribosyltransferase-isomerase
LKGIKETGGRVEVLILPSFNGHKGLWEVLLKGSGKIKEGTRIKFGEVLYGKVEEIKDGRGKIIFSDEEEIGEIIQTMGHIPLPPYIKREDEPLDRERYQTIFAEKDGAIAAPTAGLHFTHSLLQSFKDRGINVTSITLHVGIGTFTPIKVKNIQDHKMESEWVEISEETARTIQQTKERSGRIIAVGTTTTRALESFSSEKGGVRSGKGMTSLFIYPSYRFKVINGLITNFHLPKSTLIMLVSAYVGKELLMEAYQEAIDQKYRFYSYGDAMLIL